EVGRGRRVLLDQRELRALLGDDEQAPEERATGDGVRDAYVERLLENDVLRHVHEQAVPPERRVVRRELLVPADERVEPLLRLVERLEADACLGRNGVDAHTGLAHLGPAGDPELWQDRAGLEGAGVGLGREPGGVRAPQVRYPPSLLR